VPTFSPEAHDAINGAGFLGNPLVAPVGMIVGGQDNARTSRYALGCLPGMRQLAERFLFFGC